jgi:hypothetical protein
MTYQNILIIYEPEVLADLPDTASPFSSSKVLLVIWKSASNGEVFGVFPLPDADDPFPDDVARCAAEKCLWCWATTAAWCLTCAADVVGLLVQLTMSGLVQQSLAILPAVLERPLLHVELKVSLA